MLAQFTKQIVLTPTIYKILKEKAKFERHSTRVYLDILLHEVFSEDIKRIENENDDFKPFGHVLLTVAKTEIKELAISGPRKVLEDLLDKHRCGCITKDFIDVSHLNDLCYNSGDEVPRTKGLSSILLEMGFRQIKGRYFKTYKPEKKHYIWVKEGKKDEWAIGQIKKFLKEPDDFYIF